MLSIKNRKTKSVADRPYYTDVKNFLSTAIKNGKRAYNSFQVEYNRNNPRKLWNTLNKFNIHKKPVVNIPEKLKDANTINHDFLYPETKKSVYL